MMIDPMTLYAGGQFINAFSQPDPQEQLPTNLVVSDPEKFKMSNAMVKAYMSGSGDFGFGSNVKQGSSQLSQFMADRGISQGSGYYGGAMGNMIQRAMASDAANRRGYGMDLLRTPIQTAQITGQNQVPGAAELGSGGVMPTEPGDGKFMDAWKKFTPAGLMWDQKDKVGKAWQDYTPAGRISSFF